MGFMDGLPASKAVLAGQALGIASQFHEFYECFQRCDDTAMYIEKLLYILGYIVFICGFSTPFFTVLKRTERIIHHTMGASFKQFFGSSLEQYMIQGPAGILGTLPLTKAWDVMKDGAKCIRFNECEKGFNRIIANTKVNVCNVPIGPDGNPTQTDYNVCEEIFNGTPLILSTFLSAALYCFSNFFETDDDDDVVPANYDVPNDPQLTSEKKNEAIKPNAIVRSNGKRTLEYQGIFPFCKKCKSPFTCLCPAGTHIPDTNEAPDSGSGRDVGPSNALALAASTDFPPGCPWNIICNICKSPFKCSCKKPPKDNKGDNEGGQHSKKPGDGPKVSKSDSQKSKEATTLSSKDDKSSKSNEKVKATDGGKSRSSSPKEKITSAENKTSTKENETGTQKRGPGRPKKQARSKSSKTGKKNDRKSRSSKRVTRSEAKKIAEEKAKKEKRKSEGKNTESDEEWSSETKSYSDDDYDCKCKTCKKKRADRTRK